ncbi:hypothetical protein KIH41_02965 [Litoribacter ruber]|uniref:hypothetical protein n=1 Tax=Litoribacter ruber TaxID=702568 RepID=UPI001BD9918F|nr:hypothetical protein [Litoribacter ruber]MBT0810234.1 hypothetical protein [Litoribacter ruber]
MEQKLISVQESISLLERIPKTTHGKEFKDLQWSFFDKNETVLKFRPPIQLDLDHCGNLKTTDIQNYVVLLIRSGIGSVGYFENGENIDHKVFRSYMVRKKQGKSQIKHLKTKGKSRAGSRIRLAETLEFFEEINERLQEYFSQYFINKIALSCSTTLIPYLFNGKTPTPFDKSDPRIITVPRHIQNPTYETLMNTSDFLKKGELRIGKEGMKLVNELLPNLPDGPLENEDAEDENW